MGSTDEKSDSRGNKGEDDLQKAGSLCTSSSKKKLLAKFGAGASSSSKAKIGSLPYASSHTMSFPDSAAEQWLNLWEGWHVSSQEWEGIFAAEGSEGI